MGSVLSAGVERVLHLSGGDDLANSNIVVTNNQIVQGPEIADHALAMLLAHTRKLPLYFGDRTTETWRRGFVHRHRTARQASGDHRSRRYRPTDRAARLGVRHERHRRRSRDIPMSPFWQKVVKPDQLDEVIPSADVVFISAPHTPLSHKMMGPKQFDLMKKDSYFIAVSRGGIYDLPSLAKALDSKKLAGAGVDVTDPEPLPAGNSLWKFENVIITPHIAGRSDMDRGRMLGTVKENIRRFADGRPLINVVDKKKGY